MLGLGGLAGGIVRIHADELVLDGVISVNGGDGSSGSAGGSGGSIWISTTANPIGRGTISAIGGAGSQSNGGQVHGGGGSGGRIAFYRPSNTPFSGTILAYGGEGGDSINHGGPGTIFESLNSQRILTINNNNRNIKTNNIRGPGIAEGSVAWITESSVDEMSLDKVNITAKGNLAFIPTGVATIS